MFVAVNELTARPRFPTVVLIIILYAYGATVQTEHRRLKELLNKFYIPPLRRTDPAQNRRPICLQRQGEVAKKPSSVMQTT